MLYTIVKNVYVFLKNWQCDMSVSVSGHGADLLVRLVCHTMKRGGEAK